MSQPYGHDQHNHPTAQWGGQPPPQRQRWYRRWMGALIFGGFVILAITIGTVSGRDTGTPATAASTTSTRTAAAPTTPACTDCVTMPNVIGMTIPEARAALDAAGWRGGEAGWAGIAEGSIVSGQDPSPGQPVARHSSIDLYTYLPTTAPAAPPTPSGPATSVADGTYQVGVDIEAGRYKTPGPDGTDVFPNCYWQRSSDDSGEFSAIIANNNTQGPGSVTVKDGEFVTFNGGCTWTKQ